MTRERLGILRDLFLTCAKMGAITFGGGMAMLPILQREVVYTRHWATEEELIDYYAIGQCTPGIIAINTSTFIGQKQAGVAGGIAATLGMVFPSLVFISVIAGLISNFSDIAAVRNAFAGIQVCVCVLIFNATLKLLAKSVIDYRTAVIFALVLAGSVLYNLSPVWFVLLSAVTGAVLKALEARHAALTDTDGKRKSGKENAEGNRKPAKKDTENAGISTPPETENGNSAQSAAEEIGAPGQPETENTNPVVQPEAEITGTEETALPDAGGMETERERE